MTGLLKSEFPPLVKGAKGKKLSLESSRKKRPKTYAYIHTLHICICACKHTSYISTILQCAVELKLKLIPDHGTTGVGFEHGEWLDHSWGIPTLCLGRKGCWWQVPWVADICLLESHDKRRGNVFIFIITPTSKKPQPNFGQRSATSKADLLI